MDGIRYGWGGDDCLENIFNDFPPNEGKKYLVGAIEARIDPPEAMMWESSTVVGLRTPDGLLL